MNSGRNFHQEVSQMEKYNQGRFNINMLADCSWRVITEDPDNGYKKNKNILFLICYKIRPKSFKILKHMNKNIQESVKMKCEQTKNNF
jgi:hypothetical protein